MEIKNIESGEIIKGNKKDMLKLLSSNTIIDNINGVNVYKNKYITI